MMGLATVLGLARKGFFIPYRYTNVVPRPGARAPYAILGELLHEHEDDFCTLLDGMDGFASARSTRLLARAMRDGEIDGRITAIDPHPRTSLLGIRDLELLRAPVQDIGLQVY